MNRRQLLQTIVGGGLTLLTTRREAAALPPQTLDMLGNSYQLPGLPLIRPRTLAQGVKGYRISWAHA